MLRTIGGVLRHPDSGTAPSTLHPPASHRLSPQLARSDTPYREASLQPAPPPAVLDTPLHPLAMHIAASSPTSQTSRHPPRSSPLGSRSEPIDLMLAVCCPPACS